MFGLSIWQLVAGGVLLSLLAGSHWKAYSAGEHAVQRDWDAAKVEQQAAQATADESARLKAHAAALSYEQERGARKVRIVTVTKEISHAINASPDWRDGAVPDGVRRAIAAAGAALAASQPDGAVQLPAAGSADERATGAGLRVGPRRPGGLLGEAPGAR